MDQTLQRLSTELRDQWELLRTRLEELPPDRYADPSGLPGWSVADLVAHLGLAMGALAGAEAAPEAEPLSLSEYVKGYAPAAPTILDRSIELAERNAADPLGSLDRVAQEAFAGVERLSAGGGAAVVQGRRGPLRLRDLVLTRLVELVVHGYDLAPFLGPPVPVTGAARRIVAQALLEILEHRTGHDLAVADEAAWIRAAAGRITWAQAIDAGALRPEYLADGTPDLTQALPLF